MNPVKKRALSSASLAIWSSYGARVRTNIGHTRRGAPVTIITIFYRWLLCIITSTPGGLGRLYGRRPGRSRWLDKVSPSAALAFELE